MERSPIHRSCCDSSLFICMETTHNSCSPAIVFRSNKVRDDGEVGDPSLQMTIVATASESPRVTILEGGASAVFSKSTDIQYKL